MLCSLHKYDIPAYDVEWQENENTDDGRCINLEKVTQSSCTGKYLEWVTGLGKCAYKKKSNGDHRVDENSCSTIDSTNNCRTKDNCADSEWRDRQNLDEGWLTLQGLDSLTTDNCKPTTGYQIYNNGKCYNTSAGKPRFAQERVATRCYAVDCPENTNQAGIICTKHSYGRGAGKPLECSDDLEQKGGLCYEKCKEGYESWG